MMRPSIRAGGFVAIVAFLMASVVNGIAEADAGQGALSVVVPAQPNSPVELTTCYAWIVQNSNETRVVVSVVFRVRPASKTATSVRFTFAAGNAFDAPISFTGTSEGSFSPGVRIDRAHAPIGTVIPMWNYPIAGSDVTKVACAVSDVAFADGSIWHAAQSTAMK